MNAHSLRVCLLGTVSCLGLATMAAPLAAQEIPDSNDPEFLGTIVLGENKREVQAETAAPVTTINQREIDDRQASTVAELIDSVPGVRLVNGSTPQGSGINIRGFGANSTYGSDQKVLVQVDGASVGAEELYRIGTQLFTDPMLYKEVNVIRGTVGSFEYGSGAVGGVVQLETKDASDFTLGEVGTRLRQTLEFQSNGNGATSSTILAWQPAENVEFLANYVYRVQGTQEDGDGEEIGNGAFTLPSGLVKGKFSFGENYDHAITVSYAQSQTQDRDVPYDTFTTTTDAFGNVDRDTTSRTAILRYDYDPTGNDLVNFSATLSYADQKIEQSYVDGSSSLEGTPSFPFLEPLVNTDHRYETTKLTLRNTSYFETGAVSHDLRTGVELSRRERLDASSAPGGTDDRVAVFAVNDMRIGENLTITPAVRYEYQEIEGDEGDYYNYSADKYDNDALMGGLSVRYAFNSGFALFASGAYTESMPIIDDLGTPIFMTQSEKSRTWEIGGSYAGFDLFSGGDALAIKVNAYSTDLWDITSATGKRIETEGVELEAAYSTEAGYYLDVNGTVSDADEILNDGSSQDWRNKVPHRLQTTFGKRFGDALDLSWEMVGDAKITTTRDSGRGVTTDETPASLIHNLRATYTPQDGALEGMEIRFAIENAADHNYKPHLSTRQAVGRNFKLTLAKTF